MVVDRSIADDLWKDGSAYRKSPFFTEDSPSMLLRQQIQKNLKSMLRREAECSPAFKQVIPYVLVEHKPTGRLFMTTRLGGDDRLIGQHSIGLGGHIDGGESILECLYRELEEEVGLHKEDINGLAFCGLISKDDNEVDSVHLGMVYHVRTEREDISCLEADKLTGDWFTSREMTEARNNGHMESWSAICFDELIAREGEK